MKLKSLWQVHIFLAVVLVFVLTLLWYTGNQIKHIGSVHYRDIDAIEDIVQHVAQAHIWLEEGLSGDDPLFARFREQMAEVTLHEQYLSQITYNSDHSDSGMTIPGQIRQLKSVLKKLRKLAEKRIQNPQIHGIGSPLDDQFDRVFLDVVELAGWIEAAFNKELQKDINTFSRQQHALFLLALLLAGVAIFAVIVADRKRKQSIKAELQAMAKLYSAEKALQKAQAIGHVGTWDWNPNTGTLRWSNETYSLLGYKPDEVEPSCELFLERVHPDDQEMLKQAVEQSLQNKVPYNLDCRYITTNEEERIAMIQGSVEYDAQGNPERMQGVFQDITERARAEQEKQNIQKKMEHVQRLESLGILAGGIAHDFNNILTAIMGNASLARNKIDDNSPAIIFLSQIESSTQRAADLCKQMLAYSGKGKFIIKAVNLSELVEEMARLVEVSIEKNVVIKFNLAENLPTVEVDAAQMQQVILNLITNANEAIGSKSGVVSFSTGVMQADHTYLASSYIDEILPEGRYVFIEVSDTGCGMDTKTLAKIFDPFFSTKFTGRGLGMSAVLGIIRGHRGAIRIYSEPGKGTTFKVLLPESSNILAAESDVIERDSWKATGTILIVDDEETIREVASMMLINMGFNTLAARDGVEALSVYRQKQKEIVAVLMDMTMPKMDGKECFRELRRINPDVKVILSSGYNEQDATSCFVGQGLAGFIQKPYSMEELSVKVKSILGRKNPDT